MAYYPLKVKDDQGNTHVVGDPRTASKADESALTSHTSATTSVHGIADTSALETTTGAQAKADAAEAASASYTDSAVAAIDLSGYVANGLVSGKGSLIAATADDTPADLPVGTDGQILYADSGETTGLRWGAAPSGGGGLNPFLLMGA